jgi:DNA replication protein DnaC
MGVIKKENVQMMQPDTAASQSKYCPVCGKKLETVEFDLLGKHFEIPKQCECEKMKRQEEERLAQYWEKRQKLERTFSISQLGPRFKECTFANWSPAAGSEKAYELCKAYVEGFKDNKGDGVLIYGPPGNGKSHLAAAVVNELIDSGYTCIFQNVPALLSRIRKTFDGGQETEAAIYNALKECDLLVLDDIGSQMWSEWREEVLYMVINDRYYWKRPIIATSNLAPDALAKNIGKRTMDRLLEMCVIVEDKAASYRERIAFERLKALRG